MSIVPRKGEIFVSCDNEGEGFKPNPKKVETIEKLPAPNSVVSVFMLKKF